MQYPNLAIKLSNQLSQAQRRSATEAGFPLSIGQEGHLRSLPERTARPSELEVPRSYGELRDLHWHPPLHPGREPSSSTRLTNRNNFNAYADANSEDFAKYQALIQQANKTAKLLSKLLTRQQRAQSAVKNAWPPLTPDQLAEADAPLPRVESGYIDIRIGGAERLKIMLQRWESVGLTEDEFNQIIDPLTISSLGHQKSAVDDFSEGLCCELDVEIISH